MTCVRIDTRLFINNFRFGGPTSYKGGQSGRAGSFSLNKWNSPPSRRWGFKEQHLALPLDPDKGNKTQTAKAQAQERSGAERPGLGPGHTQSGATKPSGLPASGERALDPRPGLAEGPLCLNRYTEGAWEPPSQSNTSFPAPQQSVRETFSYGPASADRTFDFFCCLGKKMGALRTLLPK